MEQHLDNLRDIVGLLESNPKLEHILILLREDVDKLVNKYERMYYRKELKYKKIVDMHEEKEREIMLVYGCMEKFLPYMVAYQAAQFNIE